MEKGTLVQLRNLNRSAVPYDPEKNMKSAKDFLELVLVTHPGSRRRGNEEQEGDGVRV